MNDRCNFPGSKWWKFDFHVHTPASADYGMGDSLLKKLNPEEWLCKAMESGIDCVVVTDHNSGDWVDQLKLKNKKLDELVEKPEWYRKLVIFPGVEITVADSRGRVHLLAVFDPECNTANINSFLGSCGIMSGHGDEQRTSTKTGFSETVQKIIDAGGIAIPAHVDKPKGLFDGVGSLTPELEKSLERVFAVEFCADEFSLVEPAFKKVLDRLARVVGSDAHKPEDIGQSFCWLKMNSPTIEGLKLALQDREFCLKNQIEDPNNLPDFFLSNLSIKDMSHCGRIKDHPFVISFSPHFNSVIGGRGTGKSTIVESIRIASRRDQSLADEAPGIKKKLDNFMLLSRQKKGVMLNDTEIVLEIFKRNSKYRLHWRFDGRGTILEKEIDGKWQEMETGDLIERFPVSIFSQKQINELSANTQGLLNIIDRSDEVNRTEWFSRWETIRSKFLQLCERERELSGQLAEEPQLRIKLSDVENDLKLYEEKGHGEILKLYQKRCQQNSSIPDDKVFDNLSAGLRELALNAELSDFPSHLFDDRDEATDGMRQIHEQTSIELKGIGSALVKIAGELEVLKKRRRDSIQASKWYKSLNDSIFAYESLVEEYREKNSSLSISIYGDWVQKRSLLQQQLKKLATVSKDLESVKKQTGELYGKLYDLRVELYEKRKAFLTKVIGLNSFVQMDLVLCGDVSNIEDEYRSVLNLERDTFASSVYDKDNERAILYRFKNWEENGYSAEDLIYLIKDIQDKTHAIASGNNPDFDLRFVNRLKDQMQRNPRVFDSLKTLWPEDQLQVKYSKDPASGKFENLEKGSAGQKASAILAFLLSYGNEPLIIDQPEDDLDNALIYELIVRKIHENKNGRQLIIVTHNPNIVVNGDAELVHILKFTNGQVQIDKQGGLEELDIKESVCKIMEGGKQAFYKRYKRIMPEGGENV